MANLFKQDYRIIISFDNGGNLMWDVARKGEPHYVGDNEKELFMIKQSCEEVIQHIDRLLNKKRLII